SLAPCKHGERRNRADVVTLAELCELVGVHLDDEHLSCLACGDFLQLGRDHPARSAPGRPVIDDDRDRGARHEAIEVGDAVQLEWFAGRTERLLALAAATLVAQAREGKPVLLPARRARNDEAAIVNLDACHEPFLHGAAPWIACASRTPAASVPPPGPVMRSRRRAARP